MTVGNIILGLILIASAIAQMINTHRSKDAIGWFFNMAVITFISLVLVLIWIAIFVWF